MNSTNDNNADRLARSVFDEQVVLLGHERRSANKPEYFPLTGTQGAQSYFESPVHCVMESIDFEFPGGGTPDGLIDRLADYWAAQGEEHLVAMAPHLKAIASALFEEAAKDDGEVDIFCYTMF